MTPAICVEPLYPGLETEEKIARVAAAGFRHVEFWGWRDKNIPAVRAACSEHDVRVVNFSCHRAGSLVAKETHSDLFADAQDAVTTARALDCQTLMLLTNALNSDGSVANEFAEISDEIKLKSTVAASRELISRVPEDITLVLEPLNTLVDHPGYYLADIDTASTIVREVGSARFKILCDLYHFGIMGADLRKIVKDHLSEIGHFHIADLPGRHEPGSGTVDWAAILRLIQDQGYTGCIGFEYFPNGDSDASLETVHKLWESSVDH